MNWTPITEKKLEKVIESQCSELSKDELRYFNQLRVPLEQVKIDRNGNHEEVFIVAKQGTTIIFYEDIEEGFEITRLNEKGIISEYGVNQFTIQHITNQLRESNSQQSNK